MRPARARSLEKPLIYRKRVERRPTGESNGEEGYWPVKKGAQGDGWLRRSAKVPFPAKSLSQSWPRIITGQVIPKLDNWPVTSSTKTKGQKSPLCKCPGRGFLPYGVSLDLSLNSKEKGPADLRLFRLWFEFHAKCRKFHRDAENILVCILFSHLMLNIIKREFQFVLDIQDILQCAWYYKIMKIITQNDNYISKDYD